MRWNILSSTIPKTHKQAIKILLKNRSIDKTEIKEFFAPTSPLEFKPSDVGIDKEQLEKATHRIQIAIEKQESVVIFGDYDADGVCATTVLWEALQELGLEARVFIPDRQKHGYGMTDRSLKDLLQGKKPDLIITVDNGIVALQAVEQLMNQGIDVIVTDHHVPEKQKKSNKKQDKNFELPKAYSIVHTTELCGTTVAWMLARALGAKNTNENLDLCGVATIADQMVLLHANRSFAYHGIHALQKSKRPALVELLQLAEVEQQSLNERTVNFVIAPRINAMGRIASAEKAFRALTSSDPEKIRELVSLLHTTNVERQELTWEMVDEARSKAKRWKDEHVIVLASEEYHEGVIGLIAGKLSEEFSKPAIVMSVGDTFVKGSARSVEGVDIVQFIRKVRDDLVEVGGHPMAAGFGLLPEKVETVQQKMFTLAKQIIDPEMLIPQLLIECSLSSKLVTKRFVTFLEKMAPFGNGNPEPVFALQSMKVVQSRLIGKDGKHLKLKVRSAKADGNDLLDVVGFGWGKKADKLTQGTVIDLAGTLALNHWNGKSQVQLVLRDVQVK